MRSRPLVLRRHRLNCVTPGFFLEGRREARSDRLSVVSGSILIEDDPILVIELDLEFGKTRSGLIENRLEMDHE